MGNPSTEHCVARMVTATRRGNEWPAYGQARGYAAHNLGCHNIMMQAMHLLHYRSYHPWLHQPGNA